MMPGFEVFVDGRLKIRREAAMGAFVFPVPLVAHLVPIDVAFHVRGEIAFKTIE